MSNCRVNEKGRENVESYFCMRTGKIIKIFASQAKHLPNAYLQKINKNVLCEKGLTNI